MRNNLYQIIDTVAGQVAGPLIAVNRDGAAIRFFAELLANKQSTYGQYPRDFALYEVGQQDNSNGALIIEGPLATWTDHEYGGQNSGATKAPRLVYTGEQWLSTQAGTQA